MRQAPGKVCIIILNWNGWADTLECLDALVQLKLQPLSIVVVDNGSTDQSVKRILSWAAERFGHIPVLESDKVYSVNFAVPPSFLLIRNPLNLGFAGGNMRIMRIGVRS